MSVFYICMRPSATGEGGWMTKDMKKEHIFFHFNFLGVLTIRRLVKKKQELAWIKILFLLNQFYFEILKNKEFLGENSEKNEMLKDNG